jgi:hypothetical protein
MKNKTKRQKSKILVRSSLTSQTKGELTTQQIIMLIIVITSFVVILFLLFRLNLGETTNKEICHNSVVLKSTGKGLVGQLDCTTNYLCISGGENCEEINPTTITKVDSNNKEEIMKVIADEMVDCWWMFGEGELNYLGADFKGYHCAICNIVKFDSSIQEKFSEITYAEFYNYLINTKKDETQAYLEYLYDVFDIDSVKDLNEKINFDNEKIFTKDKYIIGTGINPNFPNRDGIMFPFIVNSNEIEEKTTCNLFDITKA